MAARGVLIDTGPLVAILSERDQHHAVCRAEAKKLRGPFYTCWPVITEAAFLLKDRPPTVAKLLGRVRDQKIQILPLSSDDADAIAQILSKYADQDFDLADAALMHLAERETMLTVFTIDHRHFSLYRTAVGKPLAIVPAAS